MQTAQDEHTKPNIQRILQFAFIGFQVMLAIVLNVMNEPGGDQLDQLGLDPSMLMGMQAVAVLAVVMGYFIPKTLLNKAASENAEGALFMASVIRMAMFEFCGLIGFVVGFLSSDPFKAYPYLVAAVIALLVGLPMKKIDNAD